MCGIARDEFGSAIKVGGVADHVHGLLSIRTSVSVAHAMNRWKSVSSGWINRTLELPQRFEWQSGYGVFSVSPSMIAKTKRYIENQAEHHRRKSFKDEFVEFLERHGIEYDPDRVFE